MRFDVEEQGLQGFSQKSRTPTVAKEFQIGLYDPAEADVEHFWDSCSVGFFGEWLYGLTITRSGMLKLGGRSQGQSLQAV